MRRPQGRHIGLGLGIGIWIGLGLRIRLGLVTAYGIRHDV